MTTTEQTMTSTDGWTGELSAGDEVWCQPRERDAYYVRAQVEEVTAGSVTVNGTIFNAGKRANEGRERGMTAGWRSFIFPVTPENNAVRDAAEQDRQNKIRSAKLSADVVIAAKGCTDPSRLARALTALNGEDEAAKAKVTTPAADKAAQASDQTP